jgi:hypothetical protein
MMESNNMITPETSAAAAHYRIMGGWDNSQAIAEAIENNDATELLLLTKGLSPQALQIIDRLLQVVVNVRNYGHLGK